MNSRWSSIVLIALCVVLAKSTFQSRAQAALISFDYTAIGLVGFLNEGATVTGSFGWDTDATDLSPSANQGIYSGAFLTGSISGGAQDGGVFARSDLELIVQTTTGGFVGVKNLEGGPPTSIQFHNGTVSTDAVPTSIDLSSFAGTQAGPFTINRLAVAFADIGQPNATGLVYKLTSVTPTTAIPLPATLTLLLPGLIALCGIVAISPRRRDVSRLRLA